ncbi:MAG: PLP-dependent decarboxylase [Oligoflexia bacterium]|nr:PLP-dependent decarboxylase [Oligoflexia bacterium]
MSLSERELKESFYLAKGNTYIYDLDRMEEHLRSLRTEGIRLWYACKANPLSAILKTVSKSGLSVDVASIGELNQAIRSEILPENILLTGPAKTKLFISKALEMGVRTFVIESRAQLELLARLSKNTQVNVLIRLQLSWEGEASILGGSQTSVFGLSPEEWESLPKFSQVKYIGVHVFQWGNILSTAELEKIWIKTAEEAKKFAEKQNFELSVLDLGGGLGIDYSQTSLDQEIHWNSLKEIFKSVQLKSEAKEIWLELGRYAVGLFGSYITQVVERKTVREKEFLICSGGINHLVRPALVNEFFPAEVLERKDLPLKEFNVHGPLCTALDKLGTYSLPKDTSPEDFIVFKKVGAYGFTESMPFFLCHDMPGEVIKKNGKLSVCRPVEGSEKWLK